MRIRNGRIFVYLAIIFILLFCVKDHVNAGTTVLNEGIKFPDGTVQTTSASGVTGLWSADGTNIYYTAGNVGIGATNTFGRKLWVQGNIYMASGTASLEFKNGLSYSIIDSRPGGFDFQSLGNSKMVIDESGKVGIGTNSPSYLLEVDGLAGKPDGGSWTNSSDERLKDITGEYTNGLNEIALLNPITFYYKADNSRGLPSDKEYIGFIAQKVQKVFPEAVSEGPDGYLDFNMHPINVAVVNSIKELNAENEALKSENETLRQRIEKIEELLGI